MSLTELTCGSYMAICLVLIAMTVHIIKAIIKRNKKLDDYDVFISNLTGIEGTFFLIATMLVIFMILKVLIFG